MSGVRLEELGSPRSRRSRLGKNRAFLIVSALASLMSIVILVVLLGSIVFKGLKHLDLSFLTDPPSRKAEKAGLAPALWGTIWICSVCAIAALPLGVGAAVFLEEFKPKGRFKRRVHAFVELNIRNLAGVPSIVYGILGLTIFVQMFGLAGTANEPIWSFGERWRDQIVDTSGQMLDIRAAGKDAPELELRDGMVMQDEEGRDVVVRVVSAEKAMEIEEVGVVAADAYVNRYNIRSWYYLQLPPGRTVLAGGLTLMLVVLPIVIISSQEALRAVPNSLREAALATGATRWQMIARITLPAATPGVMTGSILAMSRAIGEAAPILVISGVVFIRFLPQNLMDDFTAMPLQIYEWAGRPQEEFHNVAASGIMVLLAVLLTFNTIAVILRAKVQRPLQ